MTHWGEEILSMELVITVSWYLFIGGIALAVLALVTHNVLDSLGIDTLSVGAFIVVAGATGLILSRKMDDPITVAALALVASTVISILIHFYITPLRKIESSVAVNMDTYKGATGKVITTIPADGTGEIIINTGLALTNRPAMSYDKEEIKEDSEVLVIDIIDNVFYVSKVEHTNE